MTLRAYLAARKLTQAEFAEKAKVPASQVSLWLKGERGEVGGRHPGLSNATKIERATGGAVKAASWVRRSVPRSANAAARDLTIQRS